MPNSQTKSSSYKTSPISWHHHGNHMISSAIKKKLAQVRVLKANKIPYTCSMSAICCLWVKIYTCSHLFQIA